MNNFKKAGQHIMKREVHEDLLLQPQERTGDFRSYDKELEENCDVMFWWSQNESLSDGHLSQLRWFSSDPPRKYLDNRLKQGIVTAIHIRFSL
jgi:hypothetical protein